MKVNGIQNTLDLTNLLEFVSCVSCVPASCFLIWFVSCHYWLIRVQVCVICECVFKSCLLNSISSGLLVIPGVSTLPCLPLMLSLKTIILKYFLVCVFLVSPCCGHRNRRPDQTVSVVPSPRLFCSFFQVFYLFLSFVPHARGSREFTPLFAALPSRGSRDFMPAVRGSLRRRSRLSHPAVRGSLRRRSRLSHPAVRGSLRRRSRLSHPAVRGSAIPPFAGVLAAVRGSAIPPFAGVVAAVRGSCRRRSREFMPQFADLPALSSQEMTPPSTANPGPPACLWLNARRPASDSMPAGLPLTQCPPACLWLNARQECCWLKLAGLPLTHATGRRQGRPTHHLLVSRRRPRPTLFHAAVRGPPVFHVLLLRGEGQPAVRGHSARRRLWLYPAAGPRRWVVKPAGCCRYCQASRLWYPQPAAAVLTSQPAVAVFDQSVATAFLTVFVC